MGDLVAKNRSNKSPCERDELGKGGIGLLAMQEPLEAKDAAATAAMPPARQSKR